MLRLAPCLLVAVATVTAAAHAQDIVSDTGRPAPTVFLQVRGRYQTDQFTTFVQRARVTLDGPIAPGFRYHLQAGYEEGLGLLLIDASIRWKLDRVTLTAGQFKTPFAREYVIPLPELETLDRAYVVDQLAPRRDIGVMGQLALGKDSLAVVVVNGEGQNALVNTDSMLVVVSRLVAHPAK